MKTSELSRSAQGSLVGLHVFALLVAAASKIKDAVNPADRKSSANDDSTGFVPNILNAYRAGYICEPRRQDSAVPPAACSVPSSSERRGKLAPCIRVCGLPV